MGKIYAIRAKAGNKVKHGGKSVCLRDRKAIKQRDICKQRKHKPLHGKRQKVKLIYSAKFKKLKDKDIPQLGCAIFRKAVRKDK